MPKHPNESETITKDKYDNKTPNQSYKQRLHKLNSRRPFEMTNSESLQRPTKKRRKPPMTSMYYLSKQIFFDL